MLKYPIVPALDLLFLIVKQHWIPLKIIVNSPFHMNKQEQDWTKQQEGRHQKVSNMYIQDPASFLQASGSVQMEHFSSFFFF